MVAALSGAATTSASAAATAGAATPPFVVVVQPTSSQPGDYFNSSAAPGATIRPGTLLLRNTSGHTVRALLVPVDAQTASNLGSTYAVLGSAKHGPTLWTQLSQRRVTLAPHASATVAVAVTVPRDAKPGDYLSGISIQARSGRPRVKKLRATVEIASLVRYAIGVEVRVPGPRHPSVVLSDVVLQRQPRGLVFLVRASNTGNVILKNVTGNVEVTHAGKPVAQQPIGPGTFVTATSIDVGTRWMSQQVTEGTVFHVHGTLNYTGGTAKLDRDVTFGSREAKLQQEFGGRKVAGSSSTPWAAIAAGIVALVAAIGALVFVLARRRRDDERSLAPAGTALQAAIDDPRRTDAPVSVIAIYWKEATAAWRTDTESVVRRRLRPTDTLAVADDGALVVIATDTGATSAAGFAEDLRGALARELPTLAAGLDVGTATTGETGGGAQELLSAARSDRQPVG